MRDDIRRKGRDGMTAAKPAAVRRPGWLKRWFGRRAPTTYQRCLAVHMHFAAPRSALS